MSNKVLETIGLTKYFYEPVKFKVLDNINMTIDHGEFVSIVGKSGCGKSTLLYLLSTMDTDYEGQVLIHEEVVTGKSDMDLARIRNEKIGFVFQFHYLLSEYNVLKNVMLPGLKLKQYSEKEVEHRAMEHLKTLGMQDQALKMPNQLSGGQKQRVAIARALINNPLIIMGDEPTGNLDKKNSDLVFDIFKELTQEHNQTLLVVTHDPDFAARTNRIITMEDGKIIS
ncbi:lipoprotein releasing system ATP-binding protein LolD [Flavobacterium cauense R2A-7]|uniref:Lipoprotein-releasing system ATP-binding protein n=1 Tax=Flavobacterium cauense R2A-7 TaxID=1341154 RepID=V6RXL1_9FLAO|nr:ABC transporter ATP-binding protein [Flavobacterium cauense]ESU19226.1 lipoprotein releasing system ATP-binding protein LolD [Flavobacterium cauense R2A-7]KGO82153.1 ATP-binding protein [Flavobacterium cauense R2A-7]TWI15104.1 lipoprotein-releasing system ATP-binding protein [Flavobacterium cauense R2A-7]